VINETADALAKADTMAQVVRIHAARRGDDMAFLFAGETMSFAALDEGSNRAANALAAIGVERGDRIAFLGKNTHLYFELLIAAIKIGAVMTPVNWRLAAPELAYVLNDCMARALFVGDGFAPLVARLQSSLDHVDTLIGVDAKDGDWTDYRGWRDGFPAVDPMRDGTGQEDAIQLYTSGTTGHPKGAVLTNRSVFSSRQSASSPLALLDWQIAEPGEISLLAMPCFHISGTGTGLNTLYNGTGAIVLPEYDPTTALDLIERYKVSRMFMVPAAIKIMLDHPRANAVDFSCLKYITYGASPIPLDLMRAAMERFGCGFVQMYGMTETSGTIVSLNPADHDPNGSPKMRSVGTPLPGVEISILDENGTELPPGNIGEIATRSAKNMKGYWNNPTATAATIDSLGWLRTGDAGYLDEAGYLYIHDRVKDMIISGGENVYPAEVEKALATHPAIADVAVIGVPDDKWGEAVKACVVLKPGNSVTADELTTYARAQIAGYKCPKSIDFIEALPRNATGKVLRRQLRAPYWEGRDREVN
jgi:acyl-CoA synthetase (AMP-forming)/AMP-acid ligase II